MHPDFLKNRAISQEKKKKKPSGGKLKSHRKKRLYELGNLPTLTRIGERRLKLVRGKGGTIKPRLLKADKANVLNPKTKKYESVNIDDVLENPANRHYVRRDILTKGTIIKTKLGKARITSRPAQDGVINAVLVE